MKEPNTDTYKLISPVDGSIYSEHSYASSSDVKMAVDISQSAFLDWRRVDLSERKALCQRFMDAMLSHIDEYAKELTWQMGRPIAFSPYEIKGLTSRVAFAIEHADEFLSNLLPRNNIDGVKRYVKREPLGPVLVIAPWNYPYLTAVNTIVPALLAGNVVVLKHAMQTIHVGKNFATCFEEAGAPEGVFQNIILTHTQTTDLVKSGVFEHINFTGSVRGGKTIEQSSAGTFASLGLELGGKDPAYVMSDADIDSTAKSLAEGAYFNTGQCCCGIERIYVHHSCHSKFLDAFVEEARRYAPGLPTDKKVLMGPMANASLAAGVQQQIQEALSDGAQSLINGNAIKELPYLYPEVLTKVDHSMNFMKDENFGPVVGIMPVLDDNEAIKAMNDSPYGLTASIWTKDTEHAERLSDSLDFGTVFANKCDFVDPFLAWTGVKDTGRGATLSQVGFELLTRPKSVYLAPNMK